MVWMLAKRPSAVKRDCGTMGKDSTARNSTSSPCSPQFQLEGQTEHTVVLQRELQSLAQVGAGQHRVAQNTVGGNVQTLAQY